MMDTGNECLTKMDKDTVYVSNSLLENDDSTSDFLLASGNECDDAKKSEVVMESDHDNSNDLNKENNEDTIQDPREGIEENSFKKTSVQSNTGNFNIEPEEIEKDTVKASESLHENFKKGCRNINENNSKFVGSSDNLKDSLVDKEKYKMKWLHDFNDDDHMSNVSPMVNDNVKDNLVENGINGIGIKVDDSEKCNSKIVSTNINTNNSMDSNSVNDDDNVHNVPVVMGELEGSCNDDFSGLKEDKTVEEVSASSIISKEDTIEEEKEKCEDVKTTYPEEISTKDGATELKLAKVQEKSLCLHDHVNHMENKKENMPGSKHSVYVYSNIERQVKNNERECYKRLEDKLNQLASNTEGISLFIDRKPDIGVVDMSDKESIILRRLDERIKGFMRQKQDKDNDNPYMGVYLSGILSIVDPFQDREEDISDKINMENASEDFDWRRHEGRDDTSDKDLLKIVEQCVGIKSLLPEERTTVVLRDRLKVLQRTRKKNRINKRLSRTDGQVLDYTKLQKMFDARRHIDRWMQNLTLYKIVEISKIITKKEELMNEAYEHLATEENNDLLRQLRLKYDDLMKVEIDQLLVQMNKSILEELEKLSGEDKVWLHVKARFDLEFTEKRRRELFKAAMNFKTLIDSLQMDAEELRRHYRDPLLSIGAYKSKHSEYEKSECSAFYDIDRATKSLREQNSQNHMNAVFKSYWGHKNRSRKQMGAVSVPSYDHLTQGVDIVAEKTKTNRVMTSKYGKQNKKRLSNRNKTRTTNAESEPKNGETVLNADTVYKPWYMIYMHGDKVDDTLGLSIEDYIKGMGSLEGFLLNPLLTSERIHVNTSKQEIASKLDIWLKTCHKLAKNQRDFVINVVCSEMFENALFTSNVENKRLGITLIFTKERRMPIVLPIYEGGYIDEKDRDERLHNTEYSRYRQQLGDGSDSKTNHVTNSKERKQKESQQRKNF